MSLIKKYGPYLSIALVVLALGFLFLPYVRTGFNNEYFAIGYTAIFNIKESNIPSTVTSKGGPSGLLITAVVLMVIAAGGLPFFRKDVVIAFIAGIVLSVSGVVLFLAHVILFVNLRGAAINGTFGLYLVASLVTLAGVSSLLAGIQYLKDSRKIAADKGYSYIRK
jgi:hypothetical protein